MLIEISLVLLFTCPLIWPRSVPLFWKIPDVKIHEDDTMRDPDSVLGLDVAFCASGISWGKDPCYPLAESLSLPVYGQLRGNLRNQDSFKIQALWRDQNIHHIFVRFAVNLDYSHDKLVSAWRHMEGSSSIIEKIIALITMLTAETARIFVSITNMEV